MPAFLLKRIEALLGYTNIEIFVAEWRCYSMSYVVQRQQIQNLIGNNFISFDGKPELQKDIIDYCYKNKIDLIHIEEIPEGFDTFNIFPKEIQQELYDKKHPWKIVETCHNIYFKPEEKKIYNPDGYAFVTPHHLNSTFKNQPGKKSLIPFPIDPTIQYPSTQKEILKQERWITKGEFHIINIGLWTPGKNQKYAIDIAKGLWEKYRWTYIFHFLGNQAPNFKDYWEPLMKDLPPNVFILGERNDVDKYFKMADAMLFTSNFECNPIVLKEAISHNTRIMAYNLPHYGDEYTPFIEPLTGNVEDDKFALTHLIHSPIKYKIEDYNDSVKEFANKHVQFYKSIINGK